jgi:hypothetical protein
LKEGEMTKFGFLLAMVFGVSVLLSLGQKHSRGQPQFQREGLKVVETKAATNSEGEDFEKGIEKKLGEYKRKLKEVQAKIKKLAGKAKDEAKVELSDIKEKVDAARLKLKSWKSTTEEAQEEAKAELSSIMGNIEEKYKKLVARLK